MKKTTKKNSTMRKLLPAFAMLTVSAISLSSATYAWFSMNKTVTVSTLSIGAKSDSTFLLIGTGDNNTATEIQTAKSTSITDLGTAGVYTALIPSTPATSDDITTYGATEGKPLYGKNAITSLETAATEGNWWTANSDDPANATTNTINVTPLTNSNFNQYVIKKTVYLTVAVGANQANNLSITPTFTAQDTSKDYSGIKVLVATDDGEMQILNKDSGKTDIKGSNTAITSNGVRQVDLYIYYDGKDTTVNSNNKANLVGANVTFTFDVDVVTT